MDVRSNRRTAGGNSVITANRLLDGTIVWLDESGAWDTSITNARVIPNEQIEAEIEASRGTQQSTGVVGVYGVQIHDTLPPEPVTVRERIRAFGPTTHPAFATQAAQNLHLMEADHAL